MVVKYIVRRLRNQAIENNGEVAEWLKAHAWKACVRQRTVSSNLTLSAHKKEPYIRTIWFLFF